MEVYPAGVSTRRVDDISRLLWGERMPSQTLSDKLKKIYKEIDEWRKRPLGSEYPYVFVDGVWHKRSWGRARGERERPRRHRRQHGGPARGHRGRRGHARGRGQLGAVLPEHDRTRVEGSQTGGRRPVRRTRLHGQLDAAEREIPAVHGALHAQRALRDAAQSQGMGGRRPEGHLRAGKPRIRHGQGRDVAGEMEERKLKAAANYLREGVGETATYLLPGFPRTIGSSCARTT